MRWSDGSFAPPWPAVARPRRRTDLDWPLVATTVRRSFFTPGVWLVGGSKTMESLNDAPGFSPRGRVTLLMTRNWLPLPPLSVMPPAGMVSDLVVTFLYRTTREPDSAPPITSL